MTSAGCPSAAARFISLPSPNTKIFFLLGNVYSSTNGRMRRVALAFFTSAAISISTSKCPELATTAPSFIDSMCSRVITLLSPVTVTKISPIFAASIIRITLKPSMTASRALIASTSVTTTCAPMPRARDAKPLPHHPYPATTIVLPAINILVALMMPSSVDCPVP